MKKIQRIMAIAATPLSLLVLLTAILAALGSRLEFWGFVTGFSILKWSVWIATFAAVLALLAMALAKPVGAKVLSLRYAVPPAIAMVLIFLPWIHIQEFKKYPTIADATSSFTAPPQFVALVPIREKSADNPLAYRSAEAAALQVTYFPELQGITASQTKAELVHAVKEVLLTMGMEIIDVSAADGRVEATDTTFWFGFKDDVVVRVSEQADGLMLIDARSASRVGKQDGGVNAKRLQRFFKNLADAIGK